MKLLNVSLGLLLIIWIGCAGLKPKPVYTSGNNNRSDSSNATATNVDSLLSNGNKTKDYDLQRENMISEIENLLGVPYRLGGDTPRGMDCSGLVNYVYKRSYQKTLPRRVSELYLSGIYVSRNNLNFGDLVFFNKIKSPEISHVGIFLDADKFAHASLSKGVMISSLNEAYYKERFAGARRVIQ